MSKQLNANDLCKRTKLFKNFKFDLKKPKGNLDNFYV